MTRSVSIGPRSPTQLVWSSDGATGLDVLLTRSGASLRSLLLSDSVIEAIAKPLTETTLSHPGPPH
jgi:hypothetical protein